MNLLRLTRVGLGDKRLFIKVIPLVLINIVWLSSSASGQRDTVQYFSKDNYPMRSLCSKTLVLGTDGVFFQERGCEERSIVSFGKYTRGQDGVTSFHFIPFDSIKLLRTVSFKPGNADKTIDTVKLLTLEGDTLSSALIDFDGFTDALSNKMQRWFLMTGDHWDTIGINYDQLKAFYKETYLKELPGLYKGSTIIVQVNIPHIFFYYGQWDIESPEDFQLLRRPFGLYSPDGRHRVYSLSR
ncbi:hypothetical protein [Niabella drilacis]|uniref:Uncharacterized protein n=1 Tax=Niabella drilacis (strain DSM 25811 / CCM 8410 / CCUG 62505 / LMG 26954 / E90) TaxID=1285928 RepID=A0A1G6U6V6_NIADE|nr:hypothetical protein [Niabella drilacis]SDD36317.1 hypothetical protein SAMN04487894_108146 [Niabella drilacis]